jgi:hypothetical protein
MSGIPIAAPETIGIDHAVRLLQWVLNLPKNSTKPPIRDLSKKNLNESSLSR